VPVDEENGSKTTLIYVLEHKSREAAKASFKAFGADPEWKAAAKASEANGKIVAKIESIFMTPTEYSPPLKVAKGDKPRVFEMRTYTTPRGQARRLHARFRDHTMKLFSKHGMSHLAYWTPTDKREGRGHEADLHPRPRQQGGRPRLLHRVPCRSRLDQGEGR
jgi:hypothetical protein